MPTEPAQSLRERPPDLELRADAICVWEQRVARDAPAHRFGTVPDGATEIVCAIGSEPLVCGPRTRPSASFVAPGAVIAGLRLRPAVAAGILHVDARELVDATVPAAELLGRDAADRIADSRSATALASALQRAVASRVRRVDPLAVEASRLIARGTGVAPTAKALSISERQLRRRMLAATGLAPVTLARTLRYQRFLALAARTGWPAGSLARLAAEAGYADQAHLTREGRRLAGVTPAAALRDAAHQCGPTHDHAASHSAWLAA